jgi:hypothetical protein
VAKLLARLLATAVLWVRINYPDISPKNKMGDISRRSDQHTLARHKNIQKKISVKNCEKSYKNTSVADP